MEPLVVLALLCAAALPAGAPGRWPWDDSAKPKSSRLFEQVVAPAKSLSALSQLLSPPFGRSLERAKALRFLRSKALDDGGYALIDEATRRESLLQSARDESTGNIDSAKADLACHALRSRLRFALALGKAAVAKRMASPENTSYSIQAMESAIDSMRDAARELEAFEKAVPPRAGEIKSSHLWEFHRRLLDIWDTAKKRDDIGLIGALDVRGVGEVSVVSR